MTGCWRLLAACALIVLVGLVGPALPLGQDAAAVRPGAGSVVGARAVLPLASQIHPPLRYPSPISPVWIPPPNLPRTYPVAPDPVAPGTVGLQQLVRAAGIIFSGRVTSVGRGDSISRPNAAATTVTFQVERAMRGASAGESLTIREWAGLWSRGERYHVGERVLLLLYSPSKLGFTSPVAGSLGRFALDSQGSIVMRGQQVAMLAADTVMGGKALVPYSDFAMAVRRVEQRGVSAP